MHSLPTEEEANGCALKRLSCKVCNSWSNDEPLPAEWSFAHENDLGERVPPERIGAEKLGANGPGSGGAAHNHHVAGVAAEAANVVYDPLY